MEKIKAVKNPRLDLSQNIEMKSSFDEAYAFHRSLSEYAETPLRWLNDLAKKVGVAKIAVKDESYRFGLNAFKGLGAGFAIYKILEEQKEALCTFVTCTDGNHGRAVAWAAKKANQKAVVFMPKGSEERRVKAIREWDAEVIVTEFNYNDSVRLAAKYAEENGCYLVQDTDMPGCEKSVERIVCGYSTMIREALAQMDEKPTHVFLQAGVGSMAGGVIAYLHHCFGEEMPFVGVIESDQVPCIYESVLQDKLVEVGGMTETVMAGLNCGIVNALVFPYLKHYASALILCSDEITLQGMRRTSEPLGKDPCFSSGESGAVGMGLLELLNEEEKEILQLDENSVVLLFSTEGVLR